MSDFVYRRIRSELAAEIQNGVYPAGSRLPSENQLARQYECSFHTVRKALAGMVADNLIERRVGLGSFVLDRGARRTVRGSGNYRRGLALLMQADSGMFTMTAIDALHEEAERRGLFLNIRPIRNFDRQALHAVEQLKKQGCFAVLIPRFETAAGAELGKFIESCPLPVVIPEVLPGLEKYCYYRSAYSGEIDYAMTATAFKYFSRLGYRRIGFFGPDKPHDMPLQRRLAAYGQLTTQFGLPSLVLLPGEDFTAVDAGLERWREFKGEMAVICYDDHCAVRLMTAWHKSGFRIPQDFALMGSNNSPECVSADPPLSSIAFPFRRMAAGMVAHALALASGIRGGAPVESIGAGELVIRASCGGRVRKKDELEELLDELKT